ncbi:hypothetical protein QAD02_010342 [Eretmocerus hayati]|uniref:Uncharacterized protein n=1 Tax=Eretmocerus hayati TaxID=131215 RepID=A0ACC2NBS8_9HYME|nr:hypothetical protein QAD02_010342 [Eretmocerus hayati]
MKDVLNQLDKDGFVVLEDFFKPEEVDELKGAGEELTLNLPSEQDRKIFNTVDLQQNKEQYFLDSANKVSYFFESEALEKDGKLKVHPRVCLNKVGHALHWLNPVFKKYTFSEKVKEIAFQLELIEPAVCQSMYIYKNPGVGSEVVVHQDASYLYTDPVKLVGFWIALDDATKENGCLWIAPGSHKSGVHRRYLRNRDPLAEDLLIYDKPSAYYDQSSFRPVEVRKGTCILIHGQVVHYSNANKSETSRHAYTFHVIETQHVNYSKDNWLQPPKEGFPLLYLN